MRRKIKNKKRNKEFKNYTKIILSVVLTNCLLMMWCSYVLAWFDKVEIAETLSSTVADVIVGAIIGYLCSKTIENVSKYGSRLNGTAKEQEENLETPQEEIEIIDLSESGEGK